MLDDASERQVKQRTEKCSLEQLTDAYYMIDDVLDSWNTAKIKSQIQKEAADSKAPANITWTALGILIETIPTLQGNSEGQHLDK